MSVQVGSNFRRDCSTGVPSTSGPPFYSEEGLELLPSFGLSGSGMETEAAVAAVVLLGTRKKQDLAAGMAASPLTLLVPSCCGHLKPAPGLLLLLLPTTTAATSATSGPPQAPNPVRLWGGTTGHP